MSLHMFRFSSHQKMFQFHILQTPLLTHISSGTRTTSLSTYPQHFVIFAGISLAAYTSSYSSSSSSVVLIQNTFTLISICEMQNNRVGRTIRRCKLPT